ncbi:hypothetical protein AB5N19_08901 [Seiridium cardinale]|uniref:C3H1-type domain-containing protein n=1 Tax=Seiridium cardinale TaxID=138064 RepID=A0ABR2XL63_9PEZI
MDASTSPAPNGFAINSPSDLSYSSGASRTSSRTTSPATCSRPPSPLVDLQHFTNSNIEPTSNTLLHNPLTMGSNAFQSGSGGREKLITDGSSENNTTNNTSQFQRPFQQPQILRPSAPTSSQAPRNLTSNNWRAQPRSQSTYASFDAAAGALLGHGGRGPTFPIGSQPRLYPHDAALLSYSSMINFSDTQLESCYAYCYDRGNGQYTRLIPADMLPALQNIPALQQGCQGMIVLPDPRALPSNGLSSNTEPVTLRTPPASPTTPADNIQVSLPLRPRTRLGTDAPSSTASHIRADLSTQSSASSSSASMIDLFALIGCNHLDPYQAKPYASTTPAANASSFALEQSRIDTIVASTPSTPTHHGSGGSLPSSQNNPHSHLNGPSFPSGGGSAHHHQPQRRTKIYCDKWVHEGVCAFTQQGCKYKHEMPFDKVTQHQLGLFHGLPAWWKKHQAELARQRETPQSLNSQSDNTVRNMGAGLNEGVGDRARGAFGGVTRDHLGGGATNTLAWRQQNDQAQHTRGFGTGNVVGGQDIGSRAGHSAWPFGPIAPPHRAVPRASRPLISPAPSSMANQCGITTSNVYASLDALDDSKPEEATDGARLG